MKKQRLRQAKTDAEWREALEAFGRELAAANADPDNDSSWEDGLPVDGGMDEADPDDTRVIFFGKD